MNVRILETTWNKVKKRWLVYRSKEIVGVNIQYGPLRMS